MVLTKYQQNKIFDQIYSYQILCNLLVQFNILIQMDEEFQKSKNSLDCMSIESFQSKDSCFTKYKANPVFNSGYSNRSTMSIENEEGPYDLLKKLSGSDTGKMDSEKISLKSSQTKDKLEMLKQSNEGVDKNKLGSITLQMELKNQDLFVLQQINHDCICIIYKKFDFCPMYCPCYNASQKCSQRKCCKSCFECKQKRWPEILQNMNDKNLSGKHNRKPLGLNKKDSNLDVGMYIEGGKKQPKKFREEKCECRNSKCENKYCVCFTAGNKCTIKCLCQNCRNSDFGELNNSSSESRSKTQKPYLQGGSSNQSLSDKMEFEPFHY